MKRKGRTIDVRNWTDNQKELLNRLDNGAFKDCVAFVELIRRETREGVKYGLLVHMGYNMHDHYDKVTSFNNVFVPDPNIASIMNVVFTDGVLVAEMEIDANLALIKDHQARLEKNIALLRKTDDKERDSVLLKAIAWHDKIKKKNLLKLKKTKKKGDELK